MREVVVICPQERDREAVRAAGLEARYGVCYAGSDLDALESFDAVAFLDECAEIPADGVVGTKDRSALLAALVAERRGLPGPTPRGMLACQHKPSSRALQRRVAPEATPRFALLENGAAPFEPPFFAKPVVGRLAQGARRIETTDDLSVLAEADGYARVYAEIARLAGLEPWRTRGFLAEELLVGSEVTLEGYAWQGRMTTIGVTDSVKYAGTNSFERFEYPTRLGPERQDELAGLAARVLPALAFDNGFFNVEFFVPERGPARLIEVNGRIASQFAPLVQALHGRSTYDALFALACGDDPAWSPSRPDGVAISYCLRAFEDAFVAAVPEPEEGLEVLVRPGLRLSEQGAANDVASYRLAIFAEVGESRAEAVERCRARARSLAFDLRR